MSTSQLTDCHCRLANLRCLNYQHAYEIIKKEMEKKSHLLENIAGRILDSLYNEMDGIKKATVKVSKINPPMRGKIGSVSVIMER